MSQAQRSRQKAALAYAVSVDDTAAAMDWKSKWEEYNQAVRDSMREANKKGGLLSFIRTAAFYITAVATGGTSMTLGERMISSMAAGSGFGMLGDEAYGDIEVPQKPDPTSRRFRKAQQIEQQTELESMYSQLAVDIDSAESSINEQHWVQPLMNAISFYGKDVINTMADPTKSLFGGDVPKATGVDMTNVPTGSEVETVDGSSDPIVTEPGSDATGGAGASSSVISPDMKNFVDNLTDYEVAVAPDVQSIEGVNQFNAHGEWTYNNPEYDSFADEIFEEFA